MGKTICGIVFGKTTKGLVLIFLSIFTFVIQLYFASLYNPTFHFFQDLDIVLYDLNKNLNEDNRIGREMI